MRISHFYGNFVPDTGIKARTYPNLGPESVVFSSNSWHPLSVISSLNRIFDNSIHISGLSLSRSRFYLLFDR